jgi:hypothetical protein
MFLSKLGYSELVQRIFEKITFFRVDPLSLIDCIEQHKLTVFNCDAAERLVV